MHFTLVAYKPYSAAYCRGCLMESFSSDFQYFETDDKIELINVWANLHFQNMLMRRGEGEYEFNFLIDGYQFDDRDDLRNEIDRLARGAAIGMHIQYTDNETKRLAKEAATQKAIAIKARKKQFEELKNEFGNV
jgi:hypothetical protein